MNAPNFTMSLPLQNEGSRAVRVILEPLCESFLIQPGESIVVHAVISSLGSEGGNFVVAPNDDGLTIYPPGELAHFIDSFVTIGGVRLEPN